MRNMQESNVIVGIIHKITMGDGAGVINVAALGIILIIDIF